MVGVALDRPPNERILSSRTEILKDFHACCENRMTLSGWRKETLGIGTGIFHLHKETRRGE